MLKKSEINKIRRYYFDKGYKKTQIARMVQVSRNTVDKYINLCDFSEDIDDSSKFCKKLTPYKDYILKILTDDLHVYYKQRHTGTAIYIKLKNEFPNFNVSKSSTISYVSFLKESLRNNNYGVLPLDHPAGEAQLDLGDCCYNYRGKEVNGKYLVLTFPHSNASYCQIMFNKSAESIVYAMRNIFEFIHGVPKEIWFDNDPSLTRIIHTPEKRRVFSDIFQRFIMHYNFKPVFMNPYKGNEKGAVEVNINYIRKRLLVSMPEIEDIEKYNEELLSRCVEEHKRDHYIKKIPIEDIHIDDLQALNILPDCQFKPCSIEKHKLDNYGRLTLTYNLFYYISPKLAGARVQVKILPTTIEIYYLDGTFITSLDRIFGPSGTRYINWPPYLRLLAHRPLAINHFGFLQIIEDKECKDMIVAMDAYVLKAFLLYFADYIDDNGLEYALKNLKEILLNKKYKLYIFKY